MNKDAFKHYESDIARAGGFKALPEMHQQAYEIIKEASSDFTDWDQLMAVAEEPDIQKLIEIHLEWLNQQSNQVKPDLKPTEKSVKAIAPRKKPSTPEPKRKAKWWLTKGTARERLEQLTEKMVDIRMDAFDEEEEVIASTEMEIRDLVESTAELNRNELEKIMAGWQEMIDIQSVNSVQDDLVKIGTELARIIKTLPKAKKVREPKVPKKAQKVSGGEERFTEDVRFVRSFLTLVAGDQGKNRLVNFYKRMAKANAEKRFTGSSIKTELNEIATVLHDSINEGKSRVSISSALQDKLTGIREKHQLSASVKVLKRFYNLIGQSPSQKQAGLLLKAADKIGESDAYFPEVKRVIYRLKQFIDNNEKTITIDKPTIQGLAGVLKDCGCKLSAGTWEDAVKKKG